MFWKQNSKSSKKNLPNCGRTCLANKGSNNWKRGCKIWRLRTGAATHCFSEKSLARVDPANRILLLNAFDKSSHVDRENEIRAFSRKKLADTQNCEHEDIDQRTARRSDGISHDIGWIVFALHSRIYLQPI